jgi:hypothetical protein
MRKKLTVYVSRCYCQQFVWFITGHLGSRYAVERENQGITPVHLSPSLSLSFPSRLNKITLASPHLVLLLTFH